MYHRRSGDFKATPAGSRKPVSYRTAGIVDPGTRASPDRFSRLFAELLRVGAGAPPEQAWDV